MTDFRIENKTIIPAETDPLSLHLDQTTPQTIINGAPLFEDGIRFMSLNGKLWLVTMDNAGAFVITDVSPVTLNPRRSSLWFLMPYVSSV